MLAALVFGSMFLWLPVAQNEANAVQWFVGNQAPQQVSLATDQTFVIHGDLGDSVVEIKDGRVRFTSAPCQHKICLQKGWVDATGEVLVCVPNQVAIELITGGTNARSPATLDGVTY